MGGKAGMSMASGSISSGSFLPPRVNKDKVLLSIFWFFVSIIGYFMMERYNQGLDLKSSAEMFLFSICETVFMCSMAMSYFYSW